MKKQFTIFLITILGLSFINSKIIFAQDSSLPTITSINPNPFSEGDEITIYGENLGGCSIDNEIIVNGEKKYISNYTYCTNWSNNKIVYNAGYGIKSGYIQIKNYKGQASNKFDIVVNKKNPIISSISPKEVYPGSKITVYGNDFGNKCDNVYQFYLNDDHLNWFYVNCSDWSNNTLSFLIPEDTVAGNYDLQIELNNGIADMRYSNKVNFAVLDSCTQDEWKCGEWESCSIDGKRTRACEKTLDCQSANTPSPKTEEPCKPLCIQDEWSCENWSDCSLGGKKVRDCKMIYDCPLIESSLPSTVESCQIPSTASSNTNNAPAANINREQILKATVKLICPMDEDALKLFCKNKIGCAWLGSGTVIDQYGTILTNKHVVNGTVGACMVGFINNENDIPSYSEIADVKSVSSDSSPNGDMAILKIRNTANKKFTAIDIASGNSDNLKSGDYILPFGYPDEDLFGQTITLTEGPYSGRGTTVKDCAGSIVDVSSFFKTTAVIYHGNSGGGAYEKNAGSFVGMPTRGTSCYAEIPSQVNYILSVNTIKKWLNNFGSYNQSNNNFTNLSNYYSSQINIEDISLNSLQVVSSSASETQSTTESNSTVNTKNKNKTVEEEKSLITKIDKTISKRVSGNILLQVEKNGEGWYVYPDDQKKYYLGRPADAFSIMRNLGLGIKHSELENYKNSKFPSRLAGKIMLDVEQHGEAYYVNPKDLKGYFLNKPSDAFQVMRKLGLGITNADIRKIEVGEVE